MSVNIWRVCGLALFVAAAHPAGADDSIRIRLENVYLAYIDLGFIKGSRQGTDIVEGTLTLQANGTWTGDAKATVVITQEMNGFGMDCPAKTYSGSQRLRVSAKKVKAFVPSTQSLITYRQGTADGGFLALEIKPTTASNLDPDDPCMVLHPIELNGPPLLPLNDGRWTQPDAGYVIGLPLGGVLDYEDHTLKVVGGNKPVEQGTLLDAHSNWRIRVERL